MENISPQALQDRGFAFIQRGIGGADQWQGVPFWQNSKLKLVLRGHISTASGGTLEIAEMPGIWLETLEDIDKLLSLYK